jgi:hypothetical protein
MNKEEEEIIRKRIQQRVREDNILRMMSKMDILRDVVKYLDMIKHSYDSKAALETAINAFIGSLEKHDIKYDKENNTYYLTRDQRTGELVEDFVFHTGIKY